MLSYKYDTINAMDQLKLSVSEFNALVNQHLQLFEEVAVEGEITSISISQGKWLFMDIKDDQASVTVFGFTGSVKNYRELSEGMLVQVTGTPRLYEKTARFSLNATSITPSGEGALKVAFEKLFQRLKAEGLFSLERKRALPPFPQKIGLITAKDSRAYSDFIKVLQERIGGIEIYFYPVQVQGDNAVPSIINAIDYFNQEMSDLDLLVITRGGGSIEDLIAFNDEQVVRAVFSSDIKTVCAIGHEADISLAELAADQRASTPSNAAELISPHRDELQRQAMQHLNTWNRILMHRLQTQEQTLQQLTNRLRGGLRDIQGAISDCQNKVLQYGNQTIHQLNTYKEKNRLYSLTIQNNVDQTIAQLSQLLEYQEKLLKQSDTQRILKRGFSITCAEDGTIIRSTKSLEPNQTLRTRLHDGEIQSRIIQSEEKDHEQHTIF